MIQLYEPAHLPPVEIREVLRYAGDRAGTSEERVHALLPDAASHLHPRVCYDLFPLGEVREDHVDLGFMTLASRSLALLLEKASSVLVFAATLGLDYDRRIARAQRLSPADAWLLHAIGTERIEALCDDFENWLRGQGLSLTRRFSPGYGDVPLDLQTDLFRVLDCPRKIGLTLNASLLMSPSKSVTALIGLTCLPGSSVRPDGCAACTKTDCAFRKQT